ncbi:MAG: hypothetical protein AAF573_05665 [Bacteroidota bacterium]
MRESKYLTKKKLVNIYVDDEELCVERVKSRVLKGGHDVPEEAIRRRFSRSIKNFWNEFTKITDSWLLLYNGEEQYQQVAIGEEDKYSVENEYLMTKFEELIK